MQCPLAQNSDMNGSGSIRRSRRDVQSETRYAQREIDGIERALIEAKAANLPDAAAKVSLAAWRLAGAIVDDVRDLLSEVANNFGEGKISLGDLVTLRHVLELIERLPTNVAPVEFDILHAAQRKRSCRFCAARSNMSGI